MTTITDDTAAKLREAATAAQDRNGPGWIKAFDLFLELSTPQTVLALLDEMAGWKTAALLQQDVTKAAEARSTALEAERDALKRERDELKAAYSETLNTEEQWIARAEKAERERDEARAERDLLRNKVSARALTDAQLVDEDYAVGACIDKGFGEGGGSPGEWWYERADEIDHEQKRRVLERQLADHNADRTGEPTHE